MAPAHPASDTLLLSGQRPHRHHLRVVGLPPLCSRQPDRLGLAQVSFAPEIGFFFNRLARALCVMIHSLENEIGKGHLTLIRKNRIFSYCISLPVLSSLHRQEIPYMPSILDTTRRATSIDGQGWIWDYYRISPETRTLHNFHLPWLIILLIIQLF